MGTQGRKKRVNPGRGSRVHEEEGKILLRVAREAIEARILHREPPRDKEDLPEVYHEPHGTFVTLTVRGTLRGCIGHIFPQGSVIEGIRDNAIHAAFMDPRFPPLCKEELGEIRIEISILTLPVRLPYGDPSELLSRLRPGIDGVIIKKGHCQATFLPQVWDQLPDKEAFLDHLCMKAGLEEYAWRTGDLVVSTYQVQAFEEETPLPGFCG
jgi:AmmeMemoRadiSam system protein A